MGRILQRRALGEGKLHGILVGFAGADDAVVRPNRSAHPLPLLDDVRVCFLDELAHSAEGFPAPVPEFGDSFRDELRCRLALARARLFHVLILEVPALEEYRGESFDLMCWPRRRTMRWRARRSCRRCFRPAERCSASRTAASRRSSPPASAAPSCSEGCPILVRPWSNPASMSSGTPAISSSAS